MDIILNDRGDKIANFEEGQWRPAREDIVPPWEDMPPPVSGDFSTSYSEDYS